jgi:hypothetical protein
MALSSPVQEAVDLLWQHQLRREHKAVLGRIEQNERAMEDRNRLIEAQANTLELSMQREEKLQSDLNELRRMLTTLQGQMISFNGEHLSSLCQTQLTNLLS